MKFQKNDNVIYYTDELNDDFANNNIKTKAVSGDFKYIHRSPVWHFFSAVVYYLLVIPFVWVYLKVLLRVKFINRKALKKFRKKTYYMYGNHTGVIDAFTPALMCTPRRTKIIVNPDAVSIKGIKNIAQMAGGLPVPTDVAGMRNFLKAVDHYHKKCNIAIYPEAHIWPYFTGVRNFSMTSFSYPVKHNAPVFAFFTAYTEPKGLFKRFRKANVTVYISDAMYADEGLTGYDAKKNLRDKVYEFMKQKSEFSTYEVIRYIKVDSLPDENATATQSDGTENPSTATQSDGTKNPSTATQANGSDGDKTGGASTAKQSDGTENPSTATQANGTENPSTAKQANGTDGDKTDGASTDTQPNGAGGE